MPSSTSRIAPHLAIAGAVVLAAVLRLYDFSGQLILSDEWHGLQAAALTSYGELFRMLTAGGAAIPLNLYYEWLLNTVGWSEWTVRGPSLVAGIATVAVVPYLLRGVVATRVAVATGYLLAIAPLLVFYSRYARPYALVVLLSTTGLLALHRWLTSSRHGYALLFAASFALVPWFHLLELRALLLAMGFALGAHVVRWRAVTERIRPPLLALVLMAGSVLALETALLLPAVLGSERFFDVLANQAPTLRTLAVAGGLLTGTGRPWLAAAVCALVIAGLGVLFRRDPLLAGLFATVIGGDVASVLIARPSEAAVPLVFARYVLPILPLGAIALAASLDAAARWATRAVPAGRAALATGVGVALVVAAVGGLYLAGPLPALAAAPNQFRNHQAFQGSYAAAANAQERFSRLLALKGMRVPERDVAVSEFYRRLANEAGGFAVIEYPIMIGDVFSAHFVLQEIHRKRVLGGYLRQDVVDPARVRPGLVYAVVPIDMALAPVEPPERIAFAGLVDIADVDAVRRSGARYLILHKAILDETNGETPPPNTRVPVSVAVGQTWFEAFGEPVFMDAWLMVFRVDGAEARE